MDKITITQYKDINNLLTEFCTLLPIILKDDLVGIYLFGSLAYGDFVEGRSDMDILVITNHLVTDRQYKEINKMHQDLEQKYPQWAGRIECSYTPISMFKSAVPPGDRPYFGESKLSMATYGNEWIINNYLLYHHGITLLGPEIKTLIPEINISDVQKACLQDFGTEWLPKIGDSNWLDNPHYQSYIVLNLCRILHTVLNAKVSSKKVSAEWIGTKYPRWKPLIEQALFWQYGNKMDEQNQVNEFIHFISNKLKLAV